MFHCFTSVQQPSHHYTCYRLQIRHTKDHMGPPYMYQHEPSQNLPKLSPRGSVFDFVGQNLPPARFPLRNAPSPKLPHIPNPVNPPCGLRLDLHVPDQIRTHAVQFSVLQAKPLASLDLVFLAVHPLSHHSTLIYYTYTTPPVKGFFTRLMASAPDSYFHFAGQNPLPSSISRCSPYTFLTTTPLPSIIPTPRPP